MSCGPSMKTVLTILMVAMKNVTEISGGGQFFFLTDCIYVYQTAFKWL